MRSLLRATEFPKIRKRLGLSGRPSLGSFSEAGNVFPAEHLGDLVQHLAQQAIPREKNPQLRQLTQTLTAVDGSILPALPRMLWALWMDDQHRGAKLHLQYEILKAAPVRAELTEARTDDRAILQHQLEAGRLYVLDRGFVDYELFDKILQAESSLVCRLPINAALEETEGRPLSPEDQAAGVVSDCVGRLGSSSHRRVSIPIRVVEVHRWQNGNLNVWRLATDRMDLPADLIALIYQHRWAIELFFRWMKCNLNLRHLYSESQNGMHIQVYAALIATLLLTLYTGLKPNKAILEAVCFYLQGWATEEELIARIRKLKKR